MDGGGRRLNVFGKTQEGTKSEGKNISGLDLSDGQFSERCDVDASFFNSDAYRLFLEKLNIAIVAIIFLDHRD